MVWRQYTFFCYFLKLKRFAISHSSLDYRATRVLLYYAVRRKMKMAFEG